MANITRLPVQWQESDNFVVFDHFLSEALANLTYTTLATDSGTATVGDEAGGVITLAPSDGTVADNDEVAVHTINEVFLVANGKPISAKCRMKYSEANTDDANIFFGFANAIAADLLLDNGAGPKTSGNVIGLYKVDGGTVWRCVTRHSTTTNVTDSVSTTTAGGTAWQMLEIDIADGGGSGVAQVTFYVDGVILKDSSGNPIIHPFTVSNATEMQFGVYVKNGSANNESVKIDKWYAAQVV